MAEIAEKMAYSWVDTLARNNLFNLLKKIQTGQVRIIDAYGETNFGNLEANTLSNNLAADPTNSKQSNQKITQDNNLQVVIYVNDPNFYRQVLISGTVGGGESYVRGDWYADNLTAFVRILVINMHVLQATQKGFASLAKPMFQWFLWTTQNTKRQAQKNISAHYDLSNQLYRLFLDESMMYSCAVYSEQAQDLYQASLHKLSRICQKLDLQPDDHLLEIGTGWGGMAIYAAKEYGCRVTTTTISQQQYDYASAWVEKLGLSDRIEILLKDYRDLDGQFDKLVSVEMVEAVGEKYLPVYFKHCGQLLKPNGRMLIQSITIVDQRFKEYANSMDFIKRFIFPGGCLPSVQVIADQLSKRTNMVVRHIEDIGLHYARTINDWRERFFSQLDAVKKLGFDEQFIRLWEYYLCYCEGGFKERSISTIQLLCSKPEDKSPIKIGTL